MRGSPLVRLALTIVGLLALLLPLRRLTAHHETAAPVTPISTAKTEAVRLTLTATVAPFHFAISHLSLVIWEGDSAGNSVNKQLSLELPPEGIELLLEASWAEERLSAVKLEIAGAFGEPTARTLWGEKKVSDVLTFTTQ